MAKFSTIAKVSVAAGNLEELYEMTDTYVNPSGATVFICSAMSGETEARA
ncbi:hypothetical protein P4C99_10270 [Pontiellaceae bacterium B1224]|nr:hypothetical protein [Pontiellaceae bacterium B1224]